jgi:hypothetical protein
MAPARKHGKHFTRQLSNQILFGRSGGRVHREFDLSREASPNDLRTNGEVDLRAIWKGPVDGDAINNMPDIDPLTRSSNDVGADIRIGSFHVTIANVTCGANPGWPDGKDFVGSVHNRMPSIMLPDSALVSPRIPPYQSDIILYTNQYGMLDGNSSLRSILEEPARATDVHPVQEPLHPRYEKSKGKELNSETGSNGLRQMGQKECK